MRPVNLSKDDLVDLKKVLDALRANRDFHRYRDAMNAQVHMAAEVRFSPLTSVTESAVDRLAMLIKRHIESMQSDCKEDSSKKA